MRHYSDITIFENRRRANKLRNFREDVVEYFNNLERQNRGLTMSRMAETERAQELRPKINLELAEVSEMIDAAGLSSAIVYREAPVQGGRAMPISQLENIFRLHELELSPQHLTDVIERAIGVYENDYWSAVIRTFNPLFWIGRILDKIVGLPFLFLEKIGFNRDRAEGSFIGKIVKGILYLITVAAAFLQILDILDWLGPFKAHINQILGTA